jgi:nucleoid DNA-binding protein
MATKTGCLKKNSMKKNVNLSPQLVSAYDLVLTDLFSKLTKLKEGAIKLGSLGTFHKKQRVIKSALNGRTYAYYQVSFKASQALKKELD